MLKQPTSNRQPKRTKRNKGGSRISLPWCKALRGHTASHCHAPSPCLFSICGGRGMYMYATSASCPLFDVPPPTPHKFYRSLAQIWNVSLERTVCFLGWILPFLAWNGQIALWVSTPPPPFYSILDTQLSDVTCRLVGQIWQKCRSNSAKKRKKDKWCRFHGALWGGGVRFETCLYKDATCLNTFYLHLIFYTYGGGTASKYDQIQFSGRQGTCK